MKSHFGKCITAIVLAVMILLMNAVPALAYVNGKYRWERSENEGPNIEAGKVTIRIQSLVLPEPGITNSKNLVIHGWICNGTNDAICNVKISQWSIFCPSANNQYIIKDQIAYVEAVEVYPHMATQFVAEIPEDHYYHNVDFRKWDDTVRTSCSTTFDKVSKANRSQYVSTKPHYRAMSSYPQIQYWVEKVWYNNPKVEYYLMKIHFRNTTGRTLTIESGQFALQTSDGLTLTSGKFSDSQHCVLHPYQSTEINFINSIENSCKADLSKVKDMYIKNDNLVVSG